MSGRVAATIHAIMPEQIINWRTIRDGSQTKLSLVVIAESDETPAADGYTVDTVNVLRELALVGGVYTERMHRKIDGRWVAGEAYSPTDATGSTWDTIPFTFVGAINNDTNADMPPSLGLVNINVGHYRNSADFEDSVYFCGQAQPWMSGVTVDHLKALKDAGVYVGGRNLLAVPDGGKFAFAQAGENPAVRQAMLDKLDMMIALGARLMTPGSATKTATQAASDVEAQTSIISLVASNVSEAYTQAIVWCCLFVGADSSAVEYTISSDFADISTDPQVLQQMVAGFLQGAVPLADYVTYMKRRGLFDDEKPIDDYADGLSRRTE